jgi:hypothetical protein
MSMDIESQAFRELVDGVSSRYQLWRRVIDAIEARQMVEVGVWKGEFARDMLEHCTSLTRYYMIDPWAELPDWNKPFNVEARTFEAVYDEAMQATAFAADRITVLRGRTKEVVDRIPDASLDFAYIDGDHTLRGITIDLQRILPKLKEGALLAGDDFTPDPWQHDLRYEPTLVCPYSIYFAEAMDLPIVALPRSQFVMQKQSGGAFSFTDLAGKYSDLSLNRLPPPAPVTDGRLRRTLRRVGLLK